MKNKFLPVALAGLLIAGCSAAYKTGQTPDDVYYSPGPKTVTAEIRRDEKQPGNGSYQSYFQDNDDAYLRMKVHNGGKWNSLDDQDYWYGYSGGCQCNSSWGYYNSFNSFIRPYGFNTFAYTAYYNPWSSYNWYNPGYYYPVIIVNKTPVYTNSSRPGLTGYSNRIYDRGGVSNTRSRASQYSSSQFRTIFSGTNNSNKSNSSSYDRPTRTFTPSSNSTNSSGSGGGSSRSSGGGGSSSGGSSSSGRGGRGG